MKKVPRESWWYGLGLVLLFALAAIATYTVIDAVERLIDGQHLEDAKRVNLIGAWLLTMGFMFLAAGLGMWAIQYASVRESLRRVGSFIEAMDYFHDGLVALNRGGRVVNANPAARAMTAVLETPKPSLRAAFPCLSEEDVLLLTDSSGPHEIERESAGTEAGKTLRFRSQPARDMHLVLISDVTVPRIEEAQRREAARLQLIGRIARGVAVDFNRILTIISSHTGLLSRATDGNAETAPAVDEIYRAIQVGSNLAAHMLDLSRADPLNSTADYVDWNLRRAVDLLRLTLPDGWKVTSEIEPNLPPVNLSGSQLEQAIINLALICCDALPRPGIVRITARVPRDDHLDRPDGRHAILILTSAMPADEETLMDLPPANDDPINIHDEAGAILAVLRATIEESGGSIDCFKSDRAGHVFRIALPKARNAESIPETAEMPSERARSTLAHASLLLAAASRRGDAVARMAAELDLRISRARDIMALLAAIDKDAPDLLVMERHLIDPAPAAILHAIAKLRPGMPIMVLGKAVNLPVSEIPGGIRFMAAATPPRIVFESLAAMRMAIP